MAPYTLDSMRGADAALCLECGRPSGAIVTARKAGCWVTISAHGVPAHAGTSPDEGRSALRALARELLRIEGELHGSRPGMTAVATQLHAGEVKNTVPAEAWGTIDVRAHDDADLDHALARIRAVGQHDGVVFAFSDDRGFPPMRRAPELAAAVLHELAANGQPALEESAGGVSDGSWTSHVGVPTVDGLGPIGGDDHTEREWIELASVGRASTRSSRSARAPSRDREDPDRAVQRLAARPLRERDDAAPGGARAQVVVGAVDLVEPVAALDQRAEREQARHPPARRAGGRRNAGGTSRTAIP